jgi:putative transposase
MAPTRLAFQGARPVSGFITLKICSAEERCGSLRAMPRPPRFEFPGAFYHVIARGNRRQPIFHQSGDYLRFLNSLEQNINRYHFRLYAYVLMPNHFHLLLEQQEFPLSRFMQVLLTSYARWHNERYQQIGHLFQGRYKALLCDKEGYLLELTRYIHLNPVRAKITENPEAYRWSSYRAYIGKAPQRYVQCAVVVGMFGQAEARARRAYESFVLAALGGSSRPELYAATEHQFIGDERFVEISKERSQSVSKDEHTFTVKPSITKILESISIHTGLALPVVTGRTQGEREKKARELMSGIARDYFGYSLAEVASSLNRRPNTISVLARQLTERVQRDETSRALLEKVLKSIK